MIATNFLFCFGIHSNFSPFSLFICNILPKRSTQYTELPLIRWFIAAIWSCEWNSTLKIPLKNLGYKRIEAGKHALTHIRITHDTDKCIYLKLNNWNETIEHRLAEHAFMQWLVWLNIVRNLETATHVLCKVPFWTLSTQFHSIIINNNKHGSQLNNHQVWTVQFGATNVSARALVCVLCYFFFLLLVYCIHFIDSISTTKHISRMYYNFFLFFIFFHVFGCVCVCGFVICVAS